MTQQQLQVLLQLVAQAGAATLEYWRSGLVVQQKADDSPVTAADLAAHRILTAGLPTVLDIPVLSEEACDIPLTERRQWQRWWLVDPLDGTREFVAGSAEYTVNVALIEQGRVVFGVVGVPADGQIYYGGRGQGAYRQGDGQLQRLQVADTQHPLRVAGSRRHGSEAQQAFVQGLQQKRELELISAGSSLKFCWLAEGRVDFYPRLASTSQWDTAAAQAVLEGAGGQVLDTLGQPLEYAQRENYLNPYFLAVNADPVLCRLAVELCGALQVKSGPGTLP